MAVDLWGWRGGGDYLRHNDHVEVDRAARKVRDGDRMCAVDQQRGDPLALRDVVRRLIEVEFKPVEADADRSQARSRLIKEADLFADKSKRRGTLQRVRNVQ